MKTRTAAIVALSIVVVVISTAIFRASAVTLQVQARSKADRAILSNNLGVAYMNQQRVDDAVAAFKQAYALDPTLWVARLNEAIAYASQQQTQKAIDILEPLVTQHPDSARAWFNLGLSYRSLGENGKALAAFNRVFQLDSASADASYFAGVLHEQLGQQPEAVQAFTRAIELVPYHASSVFGLARTFQRAGNTVEAEKQFAEFRRLTTSKIGVPLGAGYGEQGLYSVTEDVASPGTPPAAIPVKLTAIASIGLPAAPASKAADSDVAAGAGSGACFLDYNNDGHVDVLILKGSDRRGPHLYRNSGRGTFQESTASAKLTLREGAIACAAGDFDGDGLTDIVVSFRGRVVLYRNRPNGTFEELPERFGVGDSDLPFGVSFIDFDHDGDLDLYINRFDQATPGSNMMWRNNGNSTFTNVTSDVGLAAGAPSMTAVAADFDNDRAVDILVNPWQKKPVVFFNPRQGKFKPIEPWPDNPPSGTVAVAVADFDRDGWPDLVFSHQNSPGLSVWLNEKGRRFRSVTVPDPGFVRAWGINVVDYDNDGWSDIVIAGEKSSGGAVALLRNVGGGHFEDVSAAVGLNAIPFSKPRSIISADYDEDGDPDLVVTDNEGGVVVLRNDGGSRNGWISLDLTGLNDNKSAIGAKVEVFAGTSRQKFEIMSASGYLGQNALRLTVGLGSESEVSTLRLLWPMGVVQDEIQLRGRQRHAIREIDRRGSSCPVLFSWNGAGFQFVADMIGAGVVGHWVGPGEHDIPDPTEYLKVAGKDVVLKNGRLEFRLAEPMEEIVYLDQVRLLAVDHPTDVDVYPNEYFASVPPFPPFKVIASRNARPPVAARDDRGRDVTAELAHRDRRYVDGFEQVSFRGFSKLHGIDLDLGTWNRSLPLRLLLHGYIDYFSANSGYAAHQAGIDPVAPYVEAQDDSGRWIRVHDNMGFPAGTPRTIVADLTGRLPAGSRHIRILTNLNIYWDQVLVDQSDPNIPVRVSEAPLSVAVLQKLGYPRIVEGRPRTDVVFKHDDVSATGPYARQAGSYTRFGDVLQLLRDSDDKFALFGSGEEVALEFDPSPLPALPTGWTRDYFFFADGFNKDMDFYGATGDTVEPMPFHGMKEYPYDAGAVKRPAGILQYQLEYNTRRLRLQEGTSFRFQYKSREHTK